MQRTEVLARLIISSEKMHPDEITQKLLITPTETWVKGDKIDKTHATHKSNGWCISSGWTKSYALSDAISKIVNIPLATRNIIASLSSMNEIAVTLSCTIDKHGDDRPEMYISSETIMFLASLRAVIDIDMYY